MANTQIKITQLPSINNNNIGANTILPVVNTAGTAITEKVTVGNVANFILNEAGNLLPVAGVAEISYSVANAAQPNITSVGNLTGLTVTNLSNFHLPGGTNGYVLQTNGNGNLNWAAQSGSGNGSPGGANSQIQFNNSGLFAGSTSLTWDAANSQLNTVNIGASGATIYGNLATVNATVTTNLTAANANFTSTISNTISATGNITANFFLGNGSALTGITATANGAGPNNSIQYNANGIFAGDSDLTWNPNTNTLTTTDISANNISLSANVSANKLSVTGNASANIFIGNFLYGDGSNITNIVANSANTANLANFVVVEAVNNNFSYHVVLTTGANDYSLHNDIDDNFQYNPADGTLTVTRVDTQFLQAGNIISNLTPFVDVSYDIGSNTHRWNDLYLSNSTIYLGNATISANGNSIVVDSISVTNGNIGTIGNISALNLDGSNSNVLYGNGVFAPATGGGNANIGDFTFANTTMSTPNEDIMLIQTTDNNGNLRTQMRFDPDSGIARMIARNAEQNSTYTTWTSATYTGTEINVVDAPDLINFLNNGAFSYGTNKTFSVNGGNRLPYDGYSAGGNNATIYTSVAADPDPTTVTSMEFFWQLESKFEIDYDDGAMNINSTGMSIYIDNDQTQGPDIWLRSGDDITIQGKDKTLGSESEGGDINIYAGDGAGDDGVGNNSSSGGDIQIYAGVGGYGNSSSGSQGGFARMRAGTGGDAGVSSVAGQGGFIEISAGAGGYNNGNIELGALGGHVDIYAGQTTLANNVGGNVSIRSGEGGDNAIAGNVQIITPSSGPGGGGTWTFDGNGLLTLPGGDVAIGFQYGSQAILSNTNFGVATQGANVTTFMNWSDDVSNTSVMAAIYVNAPNANPGDIHIRTGGIGNANVWQFNNDGNLVLPGNSFSVNYANGTQVSLGGGGNTGNVTFDNVTVQGVNGLNLSAGSDFTANLAYLQVRAGDVPSHIHLDTGNNEIYDLIVGDDQNYVQVSSTGNILLSSYDSNTGQYTWTLDYNGNLTLAGGNSVIQSIANSSLDPLIPNVSTMTLTPDANYSSQVLVLDPTAPGHIHLRAFASSNIDEPSANIFLGGENTAFEVTQGANNVAKIHSGGNTWTFTNAGDLQLAAGNSVISSLPNNAGDGSGLSTLNLYPDSSTGDDRYLIIDPTGPSHLHLRAGGVQDASNVLLYLGGEQTYVQVDDGYHRVSINSYDIGNATGYNWKFDFDGNLVLPGNTFAVKYANGTQASAPLVDITNTNGLTTVYYPTFVEDRTDGQIVRADVDLSYRTDTNTLTVGNITGNTNGYTLGYLNIPQVSASNATLALDDAGKHYYSTTAGNLTLTIPNNATTSFATGTAISIVVQAAGNVLVNAASGVTLYMAGSSSAGNRVVGTYGMATLMKVASDTWFINGTGVY